MNHLPGQHTNLGRVLRAMHNAGPMTAGHIRRKAGLHPDTAVTARIRELRNINCIIPPAERIKQLDDSVIYKYHLVDMPDWMKTELRRERERMASMGRVA